MSGPSENPLERVIGEIHRRSLWQVLAIYAAASWVVFEVVETLTDGLGLPGWFPALAFVLLLIGLPVVLATAFVQEGGPGRGSSEPLADLEQIFSATEAKDGTRPRGLRTLFTWRNAIIGGVLIFALWGIVAAGWVLFGPAAGATGLGETPSDEERASIAVLPFENLSPDPENVYFADGIHEEVLTLFTKVSGLEPISRTSVMRYRGSDKSLRQIAEELGVESLLEGSVQRAGDRVRITVQLIDPETDRHLWAERYDRELSDIFAVQTDVAEKVVSALRVTLSPAEADRLGSRPTGNLEAYDLYLSGNEFRRHSRIRPDVARAVSLFEQAVELDSTFAVAHAALGEARVWLAWQFGVDPDGERAKRSIDRALEIDPELPEGHRALGAYHYRIERAYDRAMEEFEIALSERPNDVQTLILIGAVHRRRGDVDRALEYFERASRMAPGLYSSELARAYWLKRRFAEAERHADRTIASHPGDPVSYLDQAALHLASRGDTVRARETLQAAIERFGPSRTAAGVLRYYDGPRGALLVRTLPHVLGPVLEPLRPETRAEQATRHLALSEIRSGAGESDRARQHCDSALATAASVQEPTPRSLRAIQATRWTLVVKGVCHAVLRRSQEAIRAGQAVVELLPPSVDARDGPTYLVFLASVYVRAGEPDRAIETLERLGAFPSYWTPALFRVDPVWDPLRDHPRFQTLLEEYEGTGL